MIAILLGILKFICTFVGVLCLLSFILSVVADVVNQPSKTNSEDNLRLYLVLIISACCGVLMLL